MASCSIKLCETPVLAKGLCAMHYRRWERHGTPTHGDPPSFHPTEAEAIGLLESGPVIDGEEDRFLGALDMQAIWEKHKTAILETWNRAYPPWGWQQYETGPWREPWRLYLDGSPVPSSPDHFWAEGQKPKATTGPTKAQRTISPTESRT